MNLELTNTDQKVIETLINCIKPLFSVSEDDQERWVLWLDFLLETQSKFIAENTKEWDEGFGFRLGENFRSLAEVFVALNSGKIEMEQLKILRDKLNNKIA